MDSIAGSTFTCPGLGTLAKLPPEIREQIYDLVLEDAMPTREFHFPDGDLPRSIRVANPAREAGDLKCLALASKTLWQECALHTDVLPQWYTRAVEWKFLISRDAVEFWEAFMKVWLLTPRSSPAKCSYAMSKYIEHGPVRNDEPGFCSPEIQIVKLEIDINIRLSLYFAIKFLDRSDIWYNRNTDDIVLYLRLTQRRNSIGGSSWKVFLRDFEHLWDNFRRFPRVKFYTNRLDRETRHAFTEMKSIEARRRMKFNLH